MLTLAPELEGAIDLIKHAKLKNITVAAGHTNATEKDIKLATRWSCRSTMPKKSPGS